MSDKELDFELEKIFINLGVTGDWSYLQSVKSAVRNHDQIRNVNETYSTYPEHLPQEVLSGLGFALWGLEQAGYKFRSGKTACLINLAWIIADHAETPSKTNSGD